MKYYIDHEFNEDGAIIRLLSIGIKAEDGREYYAITKAVLDTHLRVNDWVRANIMPGLIEEAAIESHLVKSASEIRSDILAFIGEDKEVEFWGYYADYDWVVFCQIFGTMQDLPAHFPMYCNDLKQEMHRLSTPKDHLPLAQGRPHHALDDARWNKAAHEALQLIEVKLTAQAIEQEIGKRIRELVEAEERLKAAGLWAPPAVEPPAEHKSWESVPEHDEGRG